MNIDAQTHQLLTEVLGDAYTELWNTYGPLARLDNLYTRLERAARMLRPYQNSDAPTETESTGSVVTVNIPQSTSDVDVVLGYDMFRTDSGIDGWDASTTPVGWFMTKTDALRKIGYDYAQDGNFSDGRYTYLARDASKRYGMKSISYELRARSKALR